MRWALTAMLAITPPPTVVVDNGSLRPAAHIALRNTAQALQRLLLLADDDAGGEVLAASLRYSDAIEPALLHGTPARNLTTTLRHLAASGATQVAVVPLLLAPSPSLRAAVDEALGDIRTDELPMRVAVGTCLVDERVADHELVVRALAHNILRTARARRLAQPLRVALVDHGTPSPRVNAVRTLLASKVAALLGERALCVTGTSMERRDGPEYDFNEPLLENLLSTPPYCAGDVIIAMCFLLPGKHAGEGGDVEQILAEARARHSGLRTHVCPLLAEQPLVHQLLLRRARLLRGQLSQPSEHTSVCASSGLLLLDDGVS